MLMMYIFFFLNEEHNLYSPNIILMMKSRRRWAGRVARMENRRGSYRVLVGTSGEIDSLEDPSVNGVKY